MGSFLFFASWISGLLLLIALDLTTIVDLDKFFCGLDKFSHLVLQFSVIFLFKSLLVF